VKKLTVLMLALIAALTLSACSTPTANPAEPTKAGVSAEKPFLIDEAAKTIKIYATVNGKYLKEPTRHGLNYKEGKNGPKALFQTPGKETDVYDALIKLGARPGDNLKVETAKGQTVEGQPLLVTVTWDGAEKEYDITEVVTDSTGKQIAYKFGGNLDAAKQYMTGCMLCLDSCPVGIASNAAHPYGSFDEKKVEFRGNDKLLADGKVVTISIKVQ